MNWRSKLKWPFNSIAGDPKYDLPPRIINGFLNNHLVFRAWWLCLIGAGCLVFGVWRHERVTNVQIYAGVVLLATGIIANELKYRRKQFWEFEEDEPIGDQRRMYFEESNLRIGGQYPTLPFAMDYLAMLFVVWGTGGLASPFLPILLFAGFVGSLAVPDHRRGARINSMLAVAAVGAIGLGALSSANLLPPEFAIATGFVSSGTPLSAGDVWKLSFSVIVTLVFLLLTSSMSGKAARAYCAWQRVGQRSPNVKAHALDSMAATVDEGQRPTS